MERNFANDDFEKFLKKSADQLRMRPSDDLWKRINGELDKKRRRAVYTSAFFLVAASVFGYILIDQSASVDQPLQKQAAQNAKPARSNSVNAENQNNISLSSENQSTAKVISINQNKSAVQEPVLYLLNPALKEQKQNENVAESADALASLFTPYPVDEHSPVNENAMSEGKKTFNTTTEHLLTIESVVNSYKQKVKKKRSEFQLIFTPTISYRKLSENKSYLRTVPLFAASQSNAALYNINNVVTHRPDMGLELGFAYKYALTKTVKLRSGVQFNMSRYDIQAFNNPLEIATIALNNRSRVDSVNTISGLRNFGSSRQQDWLENMYFQMSAPVGVEIKLRGDDKTSFGIATTVQPTYVIGDRAYLISSDYKNYSQVPWLIRKWNVNTSLETFVSYSTGKVKWQVGPQVRYQLLSSFETQYPVKENLFDFGLKVGLSFNKEKEKDK